MQLQRYSKRNTYKYKMKYKHFLQKTLLNQTLRATASGWPQLWFSGTTNPMKIFNYCLLTSIFEVDHFKDRVLSIIFCHTCAEHRHNKVYRQGLSLRGHLVQRQKHQLNVQQFAHIKCQRQKHHNDNENKKIFRRTSA